MKLVSRLLVSVAVLVMAGCAYHSPIVSSISEPHGVLQTNIPRTAQQIYPVVVQAVDGNLLASTQGTLWFKPGQYTLTLRLRDPVKRDNVPGLSRLSNKPADNTFKLKVEAGMTYYLGGKIGRSPGTWTPVVWKTEKTGN